MNYFQGVTDCGAKKIHQLHRKTDLVIKTLILHIKHLQAAMLHQPGLMMDNLHYKMEH